MRYLLDSYAWIEYFIGSKKGLVVKKIIDNKGNELFTADCCLSEIKLWALQEKLDFSTYFSAIRMNSNLIEISSLDWLNGAVEKFEKRKKIHDFGIIDALLLVKQKELNCRIITGDSHFKNLKNIEFLGD